MSVSSLTFECSPGTLARAQRDPEFLQQLVDNVQVTQIPANPNDPLDSIIECEYTGIVPPEDDNTVVANMLQGSSTSAEKVVWVDAAVKCMLSLVAEFRPKLGKSLRFKNKLRMWKEIQIQLNDKGFNFTHVQIENKYRALERSFKKTKQHNQKTGRDRAVCAYEKELAEILNERPSVFPTFLLGSSSDNILTKNDFLCTDERSIDRDCENNACSSGMFNNACSSGKENEQSNFSDVETPSPKPRKRKTEDVLEELKELMQTRNDKILKEIQKSNQLKEERNEILRSLVGAFKKD